MYRRTLSPLRGSLGAVLVVLLVASPALILVAALINALE
jgi:hypothetical protein